MFVQYLAMLRSRVLVLGVLNLVKFKLSYEQQILRCGVKFKKCIVDCVAKVSLVRLRRTILTMHQELLIEWF